MILSAVTYMIHAICPCISKTKARQRIKDIAEEEGIIPKETNTSPDKVNSIPEISLTEVNPIPAQKENNVVLHLQSTNITPCIEVSRKESSELNTETTRTSEIHMVFDKTSELNTETTRTSELNTETTTVEKEMMFSIDLDAKTTEDIDVDKNIRIEDYSRDTTRRSECSSDGGEESEWKSI